MPLMKGTNNLSTNTTIQPSKVYLKVKMKIYNSIYETFIKCTNFYFKILLINFD